MAKFIQRCPVYQFKPRILYESELLLPTSLYGIQIPASLSMTDVRAPTYVSPTQMLAKLRARTTSQSGGNLGIVHGLTTAEFSVSFSNVTRQWRQVSSHGQTPMWQFLGGDVYLQITLNVYILEGDRPVANDSISRQIFAIIMEHELEHVADEIDIVSRWMPAQAYQDDRVKRYLTQAQPVDDRSFHHWYLGNGFTNWLRDGIWAREHNRRAAQQDSPANYGALQRRIDQLRIRQTNAP